MTEHREWSQLQTLEDLAARMHQARCTIQQHVQQCLDCGPGRGCPKLRRLFDDAAAIIEALNQAGQTICREETPQISEVYRTLKKAGASDETARKATQALAQQEYRKRERRGWVEVGLLLLLSVSGPSLMRELGEPGLVLLAIVYGLLGVSLLRDLLHFRLWGTLWYLVLLGP